MTGSQQHKADYNGGKPSKRVVTHKSDSEGFELERQLERMLSRVPPLITLPKPKTRCPHTGRARTGLLELIAPCKRNNFRPPVKGIYRRAHKHAQRGQWLIPAENLFRYLLGLAENSTADYLAAAKARAQARNHTAEISTRKTHGVAAIGRRAH